MSTRAHIELIDRHDRTDRRCDSLVVRLYHHFDGCPKWMGPELERKLEKARWVLEKLNSPSWWDSERVGALMVALSANESVYSPMPTFQPTCTWHTDIDYLWRVYLGPDPWEYSIECLRIEQGATPEEAKMTVVDWKKEAGL